MGPDKNGDLGCDMMLVAEPALSLELKEAGYLEPIEIENPDELINIDKLTYAHYKDVCALLESGVTEHPTHFAFPFCAVSLGDVLFVPTPYEIFSEITLRLRAYLPWPHTLSLSNTNGYCGYFPSQDQICRGGYEVDVFRTGGLYNLTENADQHLIDEVCRIVGGKE